MSQLSLDEVQATLTAPGEPFEMDEVVIRGVATRVWKHAPPNLPAVLEASRAHGDRVFLVYEDERLTFAEHAAAAGHLAQILRDRFGVAEGDRVAIAMRNFPEWSLAFWAATAAGAVVVPLNAWWTGPELEYGLEDSGSVVLFADRDRARAARGPPGEPPGAADGDRGPGRGRRRAPRRRAAVRRRPRRRAGRRDAPRRSTIDPEDDATIFYTSGTTGRPKGALGTHRNICTNLMSLGYAQARAAARAAEPTLAANAAARTSDQNAYLLSVPFFHATGCHSVLVANLFFGGKIVIMYKWDAGRALELIERERITTFGGVPAMVWQVLDHPDFATRDISSVRSIGYGGAPARARAGPPDRGDVPRPDAEQRLRADRDVVGHHDELRRRLPPQARQRRPAGAGVRREGGRRRRRRPCRRARWASCGSRARTW